MAEVISGSDLTEVDMNKGADTLCHVVTIEAAIIGDDALRIDPVTMEPWDGYTIDDSAAFVQDILDYLNEVYPIHFNIVDVKEVG